MTSQRFGTTQNLYQYHLVVLSVDDYLYKFMYDMDIYIYTGMHPTPPLLELQYSIIVVVCNCRGIGLNHTPSITF